MRTLGWLAVLGGLVLQAVLALSLWRPDPEGLWLGVPATVLLMGVGLLGACLGATCLYFWGGMREQAASLDAQRVAGLPGGDS